MSTETNNLKRTELITNTQSMLATRMEMSIAMMFARVAVKLKVGRISESIVHADTKGGASVNLVMMPTFVLAVLATMHMNFDNLWDSGVLAIPTPV